MESDDEPQNIDSSSEAVKEKKVKKKKKEGSAKSKKKQSKEINVPNGDSEAAHNADEQPEDNNIFKSHQSSPSLKPSKFDESEQNGTHTSEPEVSTPTSEREPVGPKVSQSESMPTNSENSEQKKSHIALLVSPIKGIVQEAALKPLRNAAVKVKEDVGLLVRDPKEFAKQKKCEVQCGIPCSLHSLRTSWLAS
jgi:hypothetical protein